MTVTIIKDAKKFNAHLTATVKTATQLRAAIDTALRSALYHVWKHGDSTVMDRLNDFITNTTTVVHSNACHKWLLNFGKEVLIWDAKSKKFKARDAKVRELITEETIIKHLETVPAYYTFTPPPKFVPFNVVAALKGIIAKAEKVKDEHDNGTMADEDFAKCDLTGLAVVERMLKNIEEKANKAIDAAASAPDEEDEDNDKAFVVAARRSNNGNGKASASGELVELHS